jgi:hypothetical protein
LLLEAHFLIFDLNLDCVPRADPMVAARAGVGAALGQHRAVPCVRNARRPCIRFPYGFAALAFVGALLLSFGEGILPVDAAQPTSSGRTAETNAAFSNPERLRLTLALARTYRLSDQPQRALDTLARLIHDVGGYGAADVA